MNITRENIDALNAVVKVEMSAADYEQKVVDVLNDYRKTANIPGFRKGHVPMGLVKKQYGMSVKVDEVNKLLQESMNNYMTEEKLEVLGNPLPKVQDDFSWDADDYVFEFELGLAPEFDVDLKKAKNKITKFDIVADQDLIQKEVENIQERYGKLVPQEEIIEGVTVTGVWKSEEREDLSKSSTIALEDIKGKLNLKKFVGSKVGDVLKLKTKNLFNDEHKLMSALGLTHDEVHGLDIPLTFEIEEINLTEKAELNQELFDKIFGENAVTTEEELRAKIKEDAEAQFANQGDQQLLNGVTEYLVENTKFDLPAEFLKKWLAQAGEKPMTSEEAEEEYAKSEKGLRYQLIEGKVMAQNDIKLDYPELVEFTKGFVKAQMAQYGQMNPEDSELNEIATRVLSNQDEAKRLQEQLVSKKLLDFYKENIDFKVKEVSFEDFVKEAYKN
ncbi:trigger factor [Flavobacteriaceae bacterium]|nr:trigger factor [Flavobacteriaceae bacterium]